jgi:hypothetical protein
MSEPGGPPQGMQIQTMQEAAMLMHEFFLSLQQAGFTEGQAMGLVSNMLSTFVVQGFHPAPPGS